MKTSTTSKLLAAALAGLSLFNTAKADVTVVFSGGNASKNVVWEGASNVLSGYTVTNLSGNSNVRSFLGGTLIGHPELGTVTFHFILNGAVGGIQDLQAQNNETSANGVTVAPTIAISSTAPEAVGIDPSPFTQEQTLVIPFLYTRNIRWHDISTITNLTLRQAVYLEGAAGALPTTYFGGTNANLPIYLVGRDLAAAVRTEIDANVYFNGTLSSWTTNSPLFETNATLNAANGNVYANSATGAIVPDPGTTYPGYPGNTSLINYGPGQNGGGAVNTLLNVVTNSIGTVSSADLQTNVALSIEGIPFTPYNVENGYYPFWSYERWLYLTSGSASPSANQLTAINTLFNYITSNTYQHTAGNQFAKGQFVPLGDLNVSRSADGGPITSTLY
jgi:hypothetical protein